MRVHVNDLTSLKLGASERCDKVILPDKLLLLEAGTTNSFYQFSDFRDSVS